MPNVVVLEGMQQLPRFKMATMSFSGKERQQLQEQWNSTAGQCNQNIRPSLSHLQSLYGL